MSKRTPTPELWKAFDKIGPQSQWAERADAPVAIYRDQRRRNALFHICDEYAGNPITPRGHKTLVDAMVAAEKLWPAKHKRITAIVPEGFDIKAAVAAYLKGQCDG